MVKPGISASGRRTGSRWWVVGLVTVVVVAALIGYQSVQPFSDWVNDVLGSLSIGQ